MHVASDVNETASQMVEQDVHAAEPGALAYEPAGQRVHAPGEPYDPTGHSVGRHACPLAAKPKGHAGVQLPAPATETDPAEQGAQSPPGVE